MKSRQGMALAEVLTSASVLGLLLLVAGLSMVAYLRGTQQLLPTPLSSDRVGRGLEGALRILHSASALVAPTAAELAAGHEPRQGERPPLVVRVRTPGGSRLLGLTYDASRQSLTCVEYAGEYDPATPYPPTAKLRELGGAAGLRVQLSEGHLTLRVDGGPGQLPWETGLLVTW